MWHVCDYFQIEDSSAGLLGECICAQHLSGTLSRLRIEWKSGGCWVCSRWVLLLSLFCVKWNFVATTKLDKDARMDEFSTLKPGGVLLSDRWGLMHWQIRQVFVVRRTSGGRSGCTHTQENLPASTLPDFYLSKSVLLSVIPPGSTATPALITITSRGDIAPGRK